MISVCIIWPTEPEFKEATGPVGHWLAHAPIAEDGSFRVSGLPSGDWIQAIASCEGWFNVPANAEAREDVCPSENRWGNLEHSILPSLFEFQSSVMDAVIPMQATQSASLRFVDKDAKPLAHHSFRAQRNQRFFHSSWYARDFRSQCSTAEELIAIRKGMRYQPIVDELIPGKTDEQGVARSPTFPGRSLWFKLTVCSSKMDDFGSQSIWTLRR